MHSGINIRSPFFPICFLFDLIKGDYMVMLFNANNECYIYDFRTNDRLLSLVLSEKL